MKTSELINFLRLPEAVREMIGILASFPSEEAHKYICILNAVYKGEDFCDDQ